MLSTATNSYHAQDIDALINAKVVSTNLDDFKNNITYQLTAVENSQISISPKLYAELVSGKLSENFKEPLVFDETQVTGVCVFSDRVTRNLTIKDNVLPIKLLELIQETHPEKPFNFTCKDTSCNDLNAIPLTSEEYKAGLPFQLSHRTGHCDFPGLAGGNYPIAEYFSGDLLSVKIFNKENTYVGHFNIAKTSEGNFCIGTIAMVNTHRKNLYGSKNMYFLLLKVAVQLIEDNPEAKKVSLGLGGCNLKVLYPDVFKSHTQQYQSLGLIRHTQTSLLSDAKQNPSNHKELSQAMRTIEGVIRRPINLTPVDIDNQAAINMRPEDRKDFQNSFTLVTRNNNDNYPTDMDTIKKLIKNYEETNHSKDEEKARRLDGSKRASANKKARTEKWEARNFGKMNR